MDLVIYILANVVRLPLDLSNIRDNSLDAEYSDVAALRLYASQARFLFEQQEAASGHTDDKVKQLLILSSSLATFIAAYAPLSIAWLALLPLGSSICISIRNIHVRNYAIPEISDQRIDAAEQQWCRDLITATEHNRASHAYRVRLYSAALRWFGFAIVSFAILSLFSLVTLPESLAKYRGRKSDQSTAVLYYSSEPTPTARGPVPTIQPCRKYQTPGRR
jgi:hypothetical protein